MSKLARNDDGTLPAYAWPGGYPIFYMTADNAVLCPDCANGKNGSEATETDDGSNECKQWLLICAEINYEDEAMYCEHCNVQIQSAYGDD